MAVPTLTARQRQILDCIEASMRDRGPPAVGARDRRVGGAHVALHGPQPPQHAPEARLPAARSEQAPGHRGAATMGSVGAPRSSRRPRGHVPLVGDVAAGTDVLAREHQGVDAVPDDLTGDGDLFMLRVRGESMIEAGILDGDFVVARSQPTAERGDIVVAGIPGDEATMKTSRRGQTIVLPANERL